MDRYKYLRYHGVTALMVNGEFSATEKYERE